jgi:hypothetical protein
MIPYEDIFSNLYCIRPFILNKDGDSEEHNNFVSSTLSFSSNRIVDSAGLLPTYEIGTEICIENSDSNDGTYIVNLSTSNYLEVKDYFTTEIEGTEITLINKWQITGYIEEINAKHKPIAEAEIESGDYKLFTSINTDIKINDKIFNGLQYFDVKNVVNKILTRKLSQYKYCLLKIGNMYAEN